MKRNLLAIVLIGLVILLTPSYLRLISPESSEPRQPLQNQEFSHNSENQTSTKVDVQRDSLIIQKRPVKKVNVLDEIDLVIDTDLFIAKISNVGGGTLKEFRLKNYQGGFDDFGNYHSDSLVSLISQNFGQCTPCLALFDRDLQEYEYFDQTFEIVNPPADKILLHGSETRSIDFYLDLPDDRRIHKTLSFSGNSYSIGQTFDLVGFEASYRNNIELVWRDGIKPTESLEKQENQYSGAVISQAGETDDIILKNTEAIKRKSYDGNTDWVVVKNKYFMVGMISSVPGKYGTLSATNASFGQREITPVYSASIGFGVETNTLRTSLYVGPQDYRILKSDGHSLDDAMNWGFAFIRPISKYVILGLLTFLHNPFGNFYINYGIVLILFAFLIRIVTGPLTKKSAESAQKMQQLQPKMKLVQEKYKNDPKRKNIEMMKITKKHGINPLGGCLPMLIQMPLLFALFVVFRNTIEFRGAEFIFWIKDLSQPDVIFNLPFSIPIYGSGVAILP
ncbi:MAG: membrane protein insertase YidC, partial [Fidelibacterota bacterium]